MGFAAGVAVTAGVDGNRDVAAAGFVRVCCQAFAAFGGGSVAVSGADDPVFVERFYVW